MGERLFSWLPLKRNGCRLMGLAACSNSPATTFPLMINQCNNLSGLTISVVLFTCCPDPFSDCFAVGRGEKKKAGLSV